MDVSVGTILLNREASYDNGYAHDGLGNVLIGEVDLDPGVEAGFDVQGNLYLNNRTSINSRFFVVDDWSESFSVLTGTGGFVPLSAVAGDGSYTRVRASYDTSLYSAEVSLGRQVTECVRLLGGFRWLKIDENGRLDFFGPSDGDYEAEVENNLYGFQLGMDVLLWGNNRGFITTALKAGVYENNFDVFHRYWNGVDLPGGDSASDTAFAGEIDVNLNFWLSNRCYFTSGYMLLWVDGIGNLAEQYDDYDWALTNGYDIDGEAFYHGATLSLTFVR